MATRRVAPHLAASRFLLDLSPDSASCRLLYEAHGYATDSVAVHCAHMLPQALVPEPADIPRDHTHPSVRLLSLSLSPTMPGFALGPYLSPYQSTLRPLAYYATWTAYWASYAIQPGLVTLLQALILVLTWGLPALERATERARVRMRGSEWASERWAWEHAGGRKPVTEWPVWAKKAGRAVDVRWAFVAAWEWVVRQLRALSDKMGWGKKVAGAPPGKKKDATAPRARPIALRLPSKPPPPAAAAPVLPPRPPTHPSRHSSPSLPGSTALSSRTRPPIIPQSPTSPRTLVRSPTAPSNAPSSRSNPFSTHGPPSAAPTTARQAPQVLLRSRSAALAAHAGSSTGSRAGVRVLRPASHAKSATVGPLGLGGGGEGSMWSGGSARSNGSNPFAAHSPYAGLDDGHDEAGSVWTGRSSGWKRA